MVAVWVTQWLLCFGIATISALFQIVGIFNWCIQKARKSQNQGFRAVLVWTLEYI